MHSRRIRWLLLANLVLSLASGVAMVAAPAAIADWLGITDERWIRWAGVVLVLHGLTIAALLRRADLAIWARVNLAAIAPYPPLVVGLVVAGIIDEPGGIVLALVDAAAIAAIAVALLVALRAASGAASSG